MASPQPHPTLRAAIYDRASKDRAAARKSVGEQRAENESACEANGWAVADRYVDNHLSASRFARAARPDWDRFLTDLEARRFDVVVLWESSRGDRKASQWIAFLDACRAAGALIHVTTHQRTYDMRVARDWRTLAEDGVDNAYESEKLSERIRRGLRANAAAGRPHGRVLFGYARRYDPRSGKLVGQDVDELPRAAFAPACVTGTAFITMTMFTPADIVREAAARYAAGASMKSLMVDFNRRGIPASAHRVWAGSQLRTMLTNPAYIGYRRHLGELVESPTWFPPILSEEIHYACVGRLSDPQRVGKRDSAVRHLLSGLAVCGACGGWMRVLGDSRDGSERYVCQPTDMRRSGTGHAVRTKTRVEAYVGRLAVEWMSQPEPLRVTASEGDDSGGEHERIIGRIGELRAQLDAATEEFLAGQLTAARLGVVEQRILADIADMEARSRRLRGVHVVAPARVGDEAAAVALWESWGTEGRREFLRGLFAKIEVMPLGRGRRSYTDPESVRVTWRGELEEADA